MKIKIALLSLFSLSPAFAQDWTIESNTINLLVDGFDIKAQKKINSEKEAITFGYETLKTERDRDLYKQVNRENVLHVGYKRYMNEFSKDSPYVQVAGGLGSVDVCAREKLTSLEISVCDSHSLMKLKVEGGYQWVKDSGFVISTGGGLQFRNISSRGRHDRLRVENEKPVGLALNVGLGYMF